MTQPTPRRVFLMTLATATATAGACALFPGKLVAGPGWCSAWVKKA